METINDDDSLISEFFEIFEKYDEDYKNLVRELEKFNMIEKLKSIKEEIYEEYKEYEKKGIFEFLNQKNIHLRNLLKKAK